MLFGNGIHRFFGSTFTVHNVLTKFGLGDQQEFAKHRDVPEIFDECHGFGKCGVVGSLLYGIAAVGSVVGIVAVVGL